MYTANEYVPHDMHYKSFLAMRDIMVTSIRVIRNMDTLELLTVDTLEYSNARHSNAVQSSFNMYNCTQKLNGLFKIEELQDIH